MNCSVWNFGVHCQHRGAFLIHILYIFGHFKLNQNESTLVIVVYFMYFIAIQLKFSGKEDFLLPLLLLNIIIMLKSSKNNIFSASHIYFAHN